MDWLLELLPYWFVGLFAWLIYSKRRRWQRHRFIDEYAFPTAVRESLQTQYPQLNDQQLASVLDGLREYFHLCLDHRGKMLSMPSKAVDQAWHAFILQTQAYEGFCRQAFGRFLHHTPAEGMRDAAGVREGIKRTWKASCLRRRINRDVPTSLPLLFALDAELSIDDGFHYGIGLSGGNVSVMLEFDAAEIGCVGASGGGDGDGGGCGGD